MMNQQSSRTVHRTIQNHKNCVSKNTSSAELLLSNYSDKLRKLISLQLDKLGKNKSVDSTYEYGFSIARPAENKQFVTAGPHSSKTTDSISIGPPLQVIGSGLTAPDELPEDEYAIEPLEGVKYAEWISVHTHPPYSTVEEVGLSYGDLREQIPGPDDLIPELPCDVYRSKGAIVFANDPSRLPISNPESSFSTDTYVVEQRPTIRPWLHLVERTPDAVEMTHYEANELHYKTLDKSLAGASHEELFREMMNILNDTVAELLIPLSP